MSSDAKCPPMHTNSTRTSKSISGIPTSNCLEMTRYRNGLNARAAASPWRRRTTRVDPPAAAPPP